MAKKIIGVIGQGFVGGALTQVMSRYYDVWVYDKIGKVAPGGIEPRISTPGRASGRCVDNVAEFVRVCEGDEHFTGVFFVCLPTPMKRTGECDVSIVEGVLDELASVPPFTERREHAKEEHRMPPARIAVVKSTVPPGTCERWSDRYSGTQTGLPRSLGIVFNPEFLTEANALRDFETQDRIIVGGIRPYTDIVKQVYDAAFTDVSIIKTSSTIAEMVKYLTNCFLATKVAFANEMKQVCDVTGADYDKVIEYAAYDKRLGTSHWNVPGPDGALGFGGHCFPKDLNALVHVADTLGVKTPVLHGVWEKNLEVRPPSDRDWERMKGRAVVD